MFYFQRILNFGHMLEVTKVRASRGLRLAVCRPRVRRPFIGLVV